MESLNSMSLLDGLVLVVLLLGILRGIFIGLVRECFSLASLGAAVLAVRFGLDVVEPWLLEIGRGAIGPSLAPWVAGAILVIGTVTLMTLVSRLIQRGVEAAGLSWLDRTGGAVLGAAEGALVGMLIILGITFAMGREHPAVEDSHSLALYDASRSYLGERVDELPSVAAPNGWL